MYYQRMPIEIESPEQLGYENVKYNLAESSVTDLNYHDLGITLDDLVICYGDHLGKPELRELIASEHEGISKDDILLTVGAASALFIINTSILTNQDHLIVIRPNYGINIETPKLIGCQIDYVDLSFEDNFRIDINKISSLIKPNTKMISLTYPHNPTGVVINLDELNQVIKIAENNNCYLLYDETYRDMVFSEKLPLAASLSKNVISISSISKAYGLPGIRLGWLICQDQKLFNTFLAAKEQIFICNSVIDEEIAYLFLKEKDKHFSKILKNIKNNFIILKDFIKSQSYLEWQQPEGGVVCFPRIKPELKIDIEGFYQTLNIKYKTFVGPGHWFEMDKHFMRIGYGWPESEQLKQGLNNILLSIKENIK